jgi:hypothetical protein
MTSLLSIPEKRQMDFVLMEHPCNSSRAFLAKEEECGLSKSGEELSLDHWHWGCVYHWFQTVTMEFFKTISLLGGRELLLTFEIANFSF